MEIGGIWTLSPSIAIVSSLVFFVLLWILTYALDFLRAFESSARMDGSAVFLEDPTSLKKVPCPSIFDPPQKYISLIIPAYNEELRLPGAVDETLSYLQQRAVVDRSFSYESEANCLIIVWRTHHGKHKMLSTVPFITLALRTKLFLRGWLLMFVAQVVIIDDGSTDGTAKVAFDRVKKFSVDNVRVIRLGANYGKGAAIRKGMLHSRGELLLMLDADGATKITDLEKLEFQIKEFVKKELTRKSSISSETITNIGDIPVAAFGSRAHLEKHALATRKWYRNLLMKGFHLCVILVAGSRVKDTQCGFKMFTRSAARRLFINVRLKRWCFDVELIYLCKRMNIPIFELSVNWTEIPGSKIRITSIMYMLLEMIFIRLGYGLRIWKIYN